MITALHALQRFLRNQWGIAANDLDNMADNPDKEYGSNFPRVWLRPELEFGCQVPTTEGQQATPRKQGVTTKELKAALLLLILHVCSCFTPFIYYGSKPYFCFLVLNKHLSKDNLHPLCFSQRSAVLIRRCCTTWGMFCRGLIGLCCCHLLTFSFTSVTSFVFRILMLLITM